MRARELIEEHLREDGEEDPDEKKRDLLNTAGRIDQIVADIDPDHYDTEVQQGIDMLKASSEFFRKASEK